MVRTREAAGWAVDLVVLGRFDDGTPVNAVVLRGHGEVVLVDAGAGVVDHWWPCSPDPDPPLLALGVRRADVTQVVLTHWDFDHSGGLVTGTWPAPLAPRFDAPVFVLDEELDFWRTTTDGDEQLNCGTAILAVLEEAGRLQPVPAGVEFLPGLSLVPIPGHSRGQAMVRVGSDVVLGADLVHAPEHVTRPEEDNKYDYDLALGLSTRRRELAVLARSGALVTFTHVDGWGRVVDGGAGLVWEPVGA